MNLFKKLLIVLMIIALLSTITARNLFAKGKPDPMALLRGVEAARNSIVSGKFVYEAETKSSRTSSNKQSKISIIFDGEKRNVVFEYDTISITPPDTEAKVNQIKSNQYSDEKFIELGLGRRAKAVHHFIYDGTQVISTHDRTQSATFSAPKDGGYSVIESQDPRMMGLAISGSLKLELGNILYNYENNIKITHEEVISGEKAWCVEMQRVNNPDMKLLFWISDSEGFKVWRVKTTYKNKIVSLINCEYHHSDGKNPFPTYVQMYPVYGPNAEPIEEISIKEVASDYSYKAKEKEFTLAGLGLLPGATVGDSRIPKILGYWDGEKITRIYTQLFERATNCSPNKPKKKLLIGQGGPCGWVVSWVS